MNDGTADNEKGPWRREGGGRSLTAIQTGKVVGSCCIYMKEHKMLEGTGVIWFRWLFNRIAEGDLNPDEWLKQLGHPSFFKMEL